MKKISVFLTSMIVVSAICLLSCENLTVDIPVKSIELQLKDIKVLAATPSKSIELKDGDEGETEVWYYFDEVKTIILDDLALKKDVLDNLSKIKDATVDVVTIVITSSKSEGSLVTDFVMQSQGLPTIEIDEYVLGTEYNANFKEFCSKLLLKLIFSNTIDITVKGNIKEIEEGETLTVTITMGDVTFITEVTN